MGECTGVCGMLVVTANCAIGDGSLWRRPLRSLLPRAWGAVQRAALSAGFRGDGRYEPIDRLDLVFAGDTFDLLGSRRWASGDHRPWHRATAAAAIRRDVAAAASRRAAGLVRLARRLVTDGLAVPAATRQGRPHLRLPTRVPVSITLLAGDRDGCLAPLGNWPAGLHWADRWSGDHWQVEHGQRFDPLHGAGSGLPGEPPAVTQSLAVGLVARFAGQVTGELPPAAAGGRLLADNHPLDLADAFWHLLLPRVAAASLERADRLADCWKRFVADWYREAVCEQVDVPAGFDFLGRLAAELATPGPPGRGTRLLAELCGPTVGPRPSPQPRPTAGLILGHLNETVATAAWSPLACRCLGPPAFRPAVGGVVPGETVGVSLVQPAGRSLPSSQPRALLAVATDHGDHLETLDLTAASPTVTWRPDSSQVAGQPPAHHSEAA